MSYAEVDRAYIRHFVGFGAIFLQAEPRLENAITATQSTSDGGARPDSSTENYIKGVLYGTAAVTGTQNGVTPGPASTTGVTFATPASRGLIQIEANIATLDIIMGASKVDSGEVEVDPVRETLRLRSEGRRLAHALARMLGMKGVRADMFSASPVILDDNPFAYDNMEHWRGPTRFFTT
jgi:hypothetical protein